jgi:hypothetical protein
MAKPQQKGSLPNPAPADVTAAVTQTAANLLNLFLYRVRYTDRRDSSGAVGDSLGAAGNAQFLLSARLFSDDIVGVEFGTRLKTREGLVAEIIYRMQFERGPGASEEYKGEAFAKQVAARIAPTVAFPFLRETLHSLTGKSSEPFLLPILNVGTMFEPGAVPVSRVSDPDSGAEEKHAPPARPSSKPMKSRRK